MSDFQAIADRVEVGDVGAFGRGAEWLLGDLFRLGGVLGVFVSDGAKEFNEAMRFDVAWRPGQAEAEAIVDALVDGVGAFAEHAGLPELRGRRPFGGHILSHDFVEAALMRKAGWATEPDCFVGSAVCE